MPNLIIALLIAGLFLNLLMEKRRAAPVPIKVEERDPGR
jgi:hypothetical protein